MMGFEGLFSVPRVSSAKPRPAHHGVPIAFRLMTTAVRFAKMNLPDGGGLVRGCRSHGRRAHDIASIALGRSSPGFLAGATCSCRRPDKPLSVSIQESGIRSQESGVKRDKILRSCLVFRVLIPDS